MVGTRNHSSPSPVGKVGVIFYGIGAICCEAVKYALAKDWLRIIGAIDTDPLKAGRDLGEIIGLGQALGIEVSDNPSELLARQRADVVVLTTGSFFRSLYAQLEVIARAGVNVVTSAEELAFPVLQNTDLAEKLNAEAGARGISIISAGVNPGFVMDTLIVRLAMACLTVKSVRAKRVVDVSRRRKQLQLKVGAGLGVEEFKAQLGRVIFGHIGLLESAALVAHELNLKPDKVLQSIEPLIADKRVSTEHVQVETGHVAGMRQIVRCVAETAECVNLEVQFRVGAPDPRDEIQIQGDPAINLTIRDGISGDPATVALLINSIPLVLQAKPGLLTPTGKSMSEITWQCAVDPGY